MRLQLFAITVVVVLAGIVAAAPSIEKRQSCAAQYAQCGGIGYSGATCCQSGSVCTYVNDYYSQCLASSGSSSSSSSTSRTTSTTTSSTTRASSTTTTSSRASSTTTTSSASPTSTSCVAAYGQCGGTGFSGTSCCVSGYYCYTQSQYYSQCIPGSASSSSTGASSSSTTTTTASSSTSTTSRTSSTTTTSTSSSTSTATGNPYVGVLSYIDPEYTAKVDSSIALNSTISAAATALKKYPTAIWLDTISALSKIAPAIGNATSQAGGKDILLQFVIYDLPGRDCAALSSNGELPAGSLDRYKTEYIDVAVSLLSNKGSNIKLSLVIEPDSLPNLATNLNTHNCNSTTESEYPAGVAYAIAKLSAISNTWLYVDAAHGGWLGWSDNLSKIIPIYQDVISKAKAINSNANIRGFSASVANYSPFYGNGTCPAKEYCPMSTNSDGELIYNYNPCIDEDIYIRKLNAKLSAGGLPTQWIVDTSRSGQKGIRQIWGSWCNIKGSGIGARPTANPAANVDAFVWIKPPGDSDGVSGPAGTPRLDGFCDPTTSNGVDSLSGAPQAGVWFHDEFVMLVSNANPPLA